MTHQQFVKNHQERNRGWKVWNLINTTLHQSGLYASISSRVVKGIRIMSAIKFSISVFNEPFAVLPCKGLHWDVHGLTKLMELHTNRATKHRQGKQRCKTSDIRHFQMQTWTFKSEACSAPNQRPPNSFHHENDLLSNLFVNGTHNPAQEELHRKKAATIQPSKAGCQNPQKARQTKKTALVPTRKKGKPHHSAQAPPAYTHKATSTTWLVTSALYPQTTMHRRSPTDPRARFDHTEIPHTLQIWHGNLHPMSPTKHLDWLENDQHNCQGQGQAKTKENAKRMRECKNDKTLTKGNRDKGKHKDKHGRME